EAGHFEIDPHQIAGILTACDVRAHSSKLLRLVEEPRWRRNGRQLSRQVRRRLGSRRRERRPTTGAVDSTKAAETSAALGLLLPYGPGWARGAWRRGGISRYEGNHGWT